jgi:hypothetical protein
MYGADGLVSSGSGRDTNPVGVPTARRMNFVKVDIQKKRRFEESLAHKSPV